MSDSHKTPQFLLDKCRAKYSWTSGVTRGTPSVRHQHRKDLEIAFSEINGLTAGMHYQDEEESNRKSRQEYPAEIGDDDLLAEDGDEKSNANPNGLGMVDDQPMASQWAAIHSLRKETEYLFNRFLISASHVQDPILSGLLASYPNARTIRTTGAQLFKDVLDGFQPHELSHVFAFTCFSYSISKVLYKNGRINRGDILAGLQDWRNLIVDKKEIEVFDRLAPELWPESKNHLHVNNAPQQTTRDLSQAPSISSHAAVVPGPVNLSASHLPQVSGQCSLTITGPLVFPGIEMLDTGPPPNPHGHVAISDNVIQQMNISHDYFDFSAIDLRSDLSSYQKPPDPGWPQQGTQNDPGPPGDPRLFLSDTSEPRVLVRERLQPSAKTPEYELVETGIFLVVLVFFQEISELLYALSGRTCLASRRHKLYGAQQKDQQAFYQSAKTTFFEPYYRGPASGTPAFMALLSVAEIFTQRGYIRTIAEIEHYLVTLAAAVLPPGAVFIQFISLVVSHNSPTSPAPPPQVPTSNSTGKRKREVEDESLSPEQVSSPKVPKLERKCDWPGCNNSYKDLSALGKHRVQEHIKPPPIPCGHGGCGYGNARRDRVRAHFLKQHRGVALPERLRDTKRAGSVHDRDI